MKSYKIHKEFNRYAIYEYEYKGSTGHRIFIAPTKEECQKKREELKKEVTTMTELEMKLKEIQEGIKNVEATKENLGKELEKLKKEKKDTWDQDYAYYELKEKLRELWKKQDIMINAIHIMKGEDIEW